MGKKGYGIEKYASAYYGATSTEDSPTMPGLDKFRVDLSKYVPEFLYNERTLHKIYKSQEEQLAVALWQSDDLLKQGFVDTATWSLSDFEEIYGIKTNLNISLEERREIIKAKKRGQGTCTREMIKNVCEAFSGGEVNVLENSGPYKFTIQFVGVKGIPKNMPGLINTINEIKPAHLIYDFKYTYTSWNYLDNKKLTWNNASALKWDELEIYE